MRFCNPAVPCTVNQPAQASFATASKNTDIHENHPLVVLQEPATYMRTLSRNDKKPQIPHIQTALLHPLHAETLQTPYSSLCTSRTLIVTRNNV
jgi:hypothetical protein